MAAPVENRTTTVDGGAPPGRVRARDVAAISALFTLTVVVLIILGRRQPGPLYGPDEFLYGQLARSVAAGNGLTWGGESIDIRAALLAYVLAPAWKAASTVDAYNTSKVIGGIAISTVVFPVWLLARGYVGSTFALIAAALSVLGAWMSVGSGLMTEVLAFPLGVSALASFVAYLRTDRLAWGWTGLAFAAAATYSRAQLAILVPIAFLMIAADVAIRHDQWRELIRRRRVIGLITAVVSVLGIGGALLDPGSVLGIYAPVGSVPPISLILGGLKDQGTALVILVAILPAAALIAGSARRDVWRDPALRPLLLGTWASIAGFVAISGYFLAVVPVKWSIERYVMYAVPILMVTMVTLLVRRRVGLREFAIAGVALSLLATLVPGVRAVVEERALYALALRGDSLSLSPGVSVLLTGLLATGAGAIVLWWSRARGPGAAVGGFSIVLAVLLLVQAQAAWHWQIDLARSGDASFPDDLQWVDHAAGGPVARLITTSNSPRFQLTEFFNRDIIRTYVPDRPVGGSSVHGKVCKWTAGTTGVMSFEPECGPAPTRLYLDDDFGKLTVYRQKVIAQNPRVGRVVDIAVPPPARPRVNALLYVPCAPPYGTAQIGGLGERSSTRFCQGALTGQFYMNRPGRLLLGWKGGTTSNQLQIGSRIFDLPTGKVTTIAVDVPAGSNPLRLELPWSDSPPSAPDLVSARLVQGGRVTQLLY